MKRRMLIVKTGSTLPPILEARGDFESWIASGLGGPRDAVDVCAVYEGESLPAVDSPAGVVVTGSPAMVSAREPWSEAAASWLADAACAGTPVLGICYGHQLLAHGLGGEVGPNPRGREIGTVALRLQEAGRCDPLTGGLAEETPVHTTHVEAVLRLPDSARVLAGSELDPCSVFVVGACAWGVQFHPEFDADIMRGYVDARRDVLVREGIDPVSVRAAVRETPAACALLRRFRELPQVRARA